MILVLEHERGNSVAAKEPRVFMPAGFCEATETRRNS